MSTQIVHWGRSALIAAILLSGSLVHAQSFRPRYLYAIAVPLDASTAKLTITNMAFQEGLAPVSQTIRLAFMHSDSGLPVVLSGDFTLQAGASVSFELGQFFGPIPSGNLLIQSEGPILGTVDSKPITLVLKEEVSCLAVR